MKPILYFIDDEPNLVQALRRILHSMRDTWDMRFASSGAEALKMMEKAPPDMVVSDMRMPEMDGAELLRQVQRRFPQAVRLIFSGNSDQKMISRAVAVAHQYLAKPCSGGILKDVLSRSLALRRVLHDPQLLVITGRIGNLPSLPQLYFDMLQEIQKPEPCMEIISGIIERDVAMTARILQIVNSSFFGLSRRVVNIHEAIVMLGLNTLKALILMNSVFAAHEAGRMQAHELAELWEHSGLVAQLAHDIASYEKQPQKILDLTRTVGILHDSGKVLFRELDSYGGKIQPCLENSRKSVAQAEYEVYGMSHAELGGYLLGIWGLPHDIVEPVTWHHRPSRLEAETAVETLAYIHFADCFWENRLDILDQAFLEKHGFTQSLSKWEDLGKHRRAERLV
jgi:HD-like signal output (HDOD) protein